jgi:hypothetical protein
MILSSAQPIRAGSDHALESRVEAKTLSMIALSLCLSGERQRLVKKGSSDSCEHFIHDAGSARSSVVFVDLGEMV